MCHIVSHQCESFENYVTKNFTFVINSHLFSTVSFQLGDDRKFNTKW